MIKKTIGKLRRQPKRVREGIAFWFTCAFVFVVCSVWLLNVPARFADMAMVRPDDSASVKSFFEELNNQVATVKDAIPDSESASSSAGLGNESLDNLVNRFRERASSSASSDFSVQASSSEMNASTTLVTSASSTQINSQSDNEVSAPTQREVRIVTIATTSATSSVGR
jgi:hypothetical protein